MKVRRLLLTLPFFIIVLIARVQCETARRTSLLHSLAHGLWRCLGAEQEEQLRQRSFNRHIQTADYPARLNAEPVSYASGVRRAQALRAVDDHHTTLAGFGDGIQELRVVIGALPAP